MSQCSEKRSKTTFALILHVAGKLASLCCSMHLQYLNSDPREIIHDDIKTGDFKEYPRRTLKGTLKGTLIVQSLYTFLSTASQHQNQI